MKANLDPATLLEFIEGDFVSTWDALAQIENSMMNRGNFMFARQAMLYLEVACRLCRSDQSGVALQVLSRELQNRDTRYFTRLPGACYQPKQGQFTLPSVDGNPECVLMSALFDVIRNGQAHQYQQIPVRLADGKEWNVGLTGATFGTQLADADSAENRGGHLKWVKSNDGDVVVKVRTDILFLDIRSSINAADLAGRGLSLKYLSRPNPKSGQYDFSSIQLMEAIAAHSNPQAG